MNKLSSREHFLREPEARDGENYFSTFQENSQLSNVWMCVNLKFAGWENFEQEYHSGLKVWWRTLFSTSRSSFLFCFSKGKVLFINEEKWKNFLKISWKLRVFLYFSQVNFESTNYLLVSVAVSCSSYKKLNRWHAKTKIISLENHKLFSDKWNHQWISKKLASASKIVISSLLWKINWKRALQEMKIIYFEASVHF